jgi:AcrR family transcriptional regulator
MTRGEKQIPRRARDSGLDTKRRILAIAQEMFARQGYAETSMAEIAHELGTTQAAIYYHFGSKADILEALLVGPLAAYSELAERAASGLVTPNELLGKLIDFVADSYTLIPLVSSDPSVRSMLQDRLPLGPGEMPKAIITALAQPQQDRAAMIRATASFAIVKEATLASLRIPGSVLNLDDREEILGAALRALNNSAASAETS